MDNQELSALHHAVVALNNQGALAIDMGNPRLANQAFTKAFKACRTHISLSQCPATVPETFRPEYSINQLMSWETGHVVSEGATESCCVQKSMAENDAPWTNIGASPSCIYRHAIPLPVLPHNQDSTHCGLLLSVILIFNMALAHQLGAEEEKAQSEREKRQLSSRHDLLLNKAISLYGLSYDMLRSLHSCSVCTESDIFVLTILNNMAQAHGALNETEKAEICLQRIRCLLPLCMYFGMNKGHAKAFAFFFAASSSNGARDNMPAPAA
jgi:hypothetical protein